MGDKKRIDKWHKEMNKQFEKDQKTHDYSDPEMDKWFHAMLREKMGAAKTYEEISKQFDEECKTQDYSDSVMDKLFQENLEEHCRKSRNRKIAKVAGMAASIAIALGIGTNTFTEIAYGESLIEIIRNSIEAGRFTVFGIGQIYESQFEEFENEILSYETDSIEGIFEEIITDSNVEIDELFYITNLPKQYQYWAARYDTKFQTITINSQQKDNYFHVYEELDYENVVSGTILESEIVSTVFNENLKMNIDIVKQMDNVRNKGYYLEIFCDNKRLSIEGNGSLEEFEIIAKNITLCEKEN